MKYTGMGVGLGVAAGPVKRMAHTVPEPTGGPSTLPKDVEIERAKRALDAVAAELEHRAQRSEGAAAEVLSAQVMMVQDPDVWDEIEASIEEGKSAEWAAHSSFESMAGILKSLGGTQAERAVDLIDIGWRTVATLMGVPYGVIPVSDEPFVLVADDLSPADTAVLDLTQVAALVTSGGSPTAHTAILARARGLVAVVSASGVLDIPDDTIVIVDAATGTVDSEPSAEQVEQVKSQRTESADDAPASPGRTSDGTAIPLLANVGSVADAKEALAKGAEGVGLLRTEFLFLGASEQPSVETQATEYTEIVAALGGQKVTARTLDAGADKPLPFLNLGHEENPALGVRGIRTGIKDESLLKNQLEALVQTQNAGVGELWVMAPMIADAAEAEWFVKHARAAGLNKVGVMIEVPSCALVAEDVYKVVDFVSIGTNDLTQYTMAADRQNGAVAGYQDAWHPAVLRLIGMVGAAATKAKKPLSVCGEAASDPLLALVLVGLGVTSLSMTPNALRDVRSTLVRYSIDEVRELANLAVAAGTAAGAREAVRAGLPRPPR
ncbi:MAG: phosphoenolpyruvate--protein phosphotransferase [Cryobacterium sp.]|nr:phosphoenolpyruvate--protein phosphotransferase [Cryobacterium sp.]